MAELQITPTPELRKTGGSQVLGNIGTAGSDMAGVQAVAGAIGESARVAGAFDDKKQRLKDSSGSSNNHLNAVSTENRIQLGLEKNRNDHEKWKDLAEKEWNAHMASMEEDLNSGKYTPEAVQKIKAEAALAKETSMARVEKAQAARGYELQYTSVVLAAEDLARNGHNDAAETKIKELGLEEEEEKALVKKTFQHGDFSDAQLELNGLQTLPEYEEFRKP